MVGKCWRLSHPTGRADKASSSPASVNDARTYRGAGEQRALEYRLEVNGKDVRCQVGRAKTSDVRWERQRRQMSGGNGKDARCQVGTAKTSDVRIEKQEHNKTRGSTKTV